MIHDGKMHPNVAITAPGNPAIRIPTNVAELTAIGPDGDSVRIDGKKTR